MGTALETTRHSARHAIILISMNILFIRLLQYALVLATDSGNENTKFMFVRGRRGAGRGRKWICTNSIQMRILQTYFLLNEPVHKLKGLLQTQWLWSNLCLLKSKHKQLLPSSFGCANRNEFERKITVSFMCVPRILNIKCYVYCTVRHWDSWRIRDQLDVTSY